MQYAAVNDYYNTVLCKLKDISENFKNNMQKRANYNEYGKIYINHYSAE